MQSNGLLENTAFDKKDTYKKIIYDKIKEILNKNTLPLGSSIVKSVFLILHIS